MSDFLVCELTSFVNFLLSLVIACGYILLIIHFSNNFLAIVVNEAVSVIC